MPIAFGGWVLTAYDLDPGAYPGVWSQGVVEKRKGALMKLLINAIISIAAIALMLTSLHIGGASAQSDTVQSDTVKCPPPPPAGHPNIFMRTVQCSNLPSGTGSTGSAQQPIIGNKPPPVSDDGTKPLPK